MQKIIISYLAYGLLPVLLSGFYAPFPVHAQQGAESETRLDPVRVEGSGEEQSADDPVGGYHATRAGTGTKTDVPLMHTPASIQVISQEVMDDQQTLNIDQAVKNVSGVYENIGPDGNTMDDFIIRGFEIDSYGGIYRDGVKDFSRSPAEIAGLERIEVLKGPAAILYGRIERMRACYSPSLHAYAHRVGSPAPCNGWVC